MIFVSAHDNLANDVVVVIGGQVKDEQLPEAKEEYANVLADTRDPAIKEAFKPEDLRRARDEAKMEVDRCNIRRCQNIANTFSQIEVLPATGGISNAASTFFIQSSSWGTIFPVEPLIQRSANPEPRARGRVSESPTHI